MRRIRIAIVDSGVRMAHPAFQANKPKVIQYCGEQDGNQSWGHSTAVYNIIRKTATIADIINFKITDSNGEIDENMLISCLHDIRVNSKMLINSALLIGFHAHLICLQAAKKSQFSSWLQR